MADKQQTKLNAVQKNLIHIIDQGTTLRPELHKICGRGWWQTIKSLETKGLVTSKELKNGVIKYALTAAARRGIKEGWI